MVLDPLSERHRDKATRVFDYLAELARLRTKTIRNIDEYQAVFWFDSLPRDRGCHSIAWSNEGDAQSDDVWIEVKRRPEPKCPAPHIACSEWIGTWLLQNSDAPPQLSDRIVVLNQPASETEDVVEEFSQEPEFRYLADNVTGSHDMLLFGYAQGKH